MATSPGHAQTVDQLVRNQLPDQLLTDATKQRDAFRDHAAGKSVCGQKIVPWPEYREWALKHGYTERELENIRAQALAKIKEKRNINISSVPNLPIPYCEKIQKTTYKFAITGNPTYETNVLRSDSNVHMDRSDNLGTTFLVTTAGYRPFDVIGISAGTNSSRYDQFTSKSMDSVTTQAIYQFFVGATGYATNGRTFDINPASELIPPPGVITAKTIEVALVNQTSYTPTFQTQTVDLLTPQVAFVWQNIPLLGATKDNLCFARSHDESKVGFCNSIDLVFNVGQSFASVHTTENVNFQADATLNHRVDHTDFRIALKTSVIERLYEQVPGGRRDTQLQLTPSASWSPDPIESRYGKLATSLTLPVTYAVNSSSVGTQDWRGWTIMPTLTLAIMPPSPPKPDK
jgi:hypothetical protein